MFPYGPRGASPDGLALFYADNVPTSPVDFVTTRVGWVLEQNYTTSITAPAASKLTEVAASLG